MKHLRNSILIVGLLAAGVALMSRKSSADSTVAPVMQIQATADFDAPLAPDGTWVDVRTYGRCFRPASVAVDWEPYCDGEWVWTDCGWYWDSDEPWAWACYHYGTWVFDPEFGWIWVPGVEWAPAWVDWRIGGGYIGWAPCAPRGVIIAPAFFAFVSVDHFGDRVHRSALVFNNQAVIRGAPLAGSGHESRTISGFARPIAMNRGPSLATVEKATGRHLTAVSVQDEVRSRPVPQSLEQVHRKAEPAAAPVSSSHAISQPSSAAPDRDTSRQPVPPSRNTGNPPAQSHAPSVIPPDHPARGSGGGDVQHDGGANRNEGGNRNRDDGRGRGGSF